MRPDVYYITNPEPLKARLAEAVSCLASRDYAFDERTIKATRAILDVCEALDNLPTTEHPKNRK